MGLLSWLFGHERGGHASYLHLEPSKDLRDYVVGESHRQDALSKLVGPKDDLSVELPCKAVFTSEPTNRHDPNAVRVTIDGEHVGYLPRDRTAKFHTAMRKHNTIGAVADAVILGGWDRDDGEGGRDTGNFGVKVFSKWPPRGAVRPLET
jgi:hypothetical protein